MSIKCSFFIIKTERLTNCTWKLNFYYKVLIDVYIKLANRFENEKNSGLSGKSDLSGKFVLRRMAFIISRSLRWCENQKHSLAEEDYMDLSWDDEGSNDML